MGDGDPTVLQGKLSALSGTQLADDDVPKLLREILDEGGGVTLELDHVRFKLLRRDGRFTLKKDDPRSQSTIPPPMRRDR